MELRPRKGRSVQPPSTPTPTPAIAKPSPRLPPLSSSRKKPASVPSTPIHIPSDNEDEDPKEIHIDLVDGATKEIPAKEEVTAEISRDEHTRKQGNQDIILSYNVEFDTPLSSIARLRRAHKGATANVKSKTEVTSTKKKKKMAKVLGSTGVADTSIAHDRIAATLEKVGLDEAMSEKLPGFPIEDVASEEMEKQEAFTGIVPQKSDELAVEINLLAPQEVCVKKTQVLSSSIDSKQLHSSVEKSRKKRDEISKVDDAKLDQDGHIKNIDDVDAPIVSESQGLSLILSADEAVEVSDNIVRVDGCEENISASKKAALENHLPGGEASKASRESKKSQFHKDIVEEEMRSRKLFEETSDVTIPCTDTKFDDQSTHELGLIADSSKEGVQELAEESSDEGASSREEREVDINGDHAKLDAAAASSQKNAVHDKECSSSNDDDGTTSSGSDDDDSEEDEMASAFFSSMKANLQRISEPSGLSLQKDEQAKRDDLVKLESQFTKCAVKNSCTNGGSTGYGLSWSPEIALSSLKTSKAQVGKPRSAVEARPDTIWGKDRCLQDGLLVPPVNPLKLNKLARKQKDDTAGAKWFNLSAPTITPEIKKELQLVKLRGALDPKRHYKADDSKGLPKYFQVGTVVGGPADFYSGRLTKKEQKSSLASELLSDSSLTAFRKRKYLEIQEQKQAGGKGFWKKKKSKRTPAWANI